MPKLNHISNSSDTTDANYDELLAALTSAKDLFISIAAHKLLTPITILKWNLDLIAKEASSGDEKGDEKLKDKVHDMRVNVEKLENFSSVLLKISGYLADNKKTVQPSALAKSESVDVNEYVADILDEYSKNISDLKLSIIYKPAEDVKVETTYKIEIQNVLRIIIENSIYYNREGGKVYIIVKKENGFLRIGIKDTGIGIPEVEKSMIFQPFFRTSNSQKLSVKGYGLNLYLCMLILNSIGGKINFKSKENEGSEFFVKLPI